MHIDDKHLYHGAGLIQIAEQPQCKAINPIPKLRARGVFQINSAIAVCMKYAHRPAGIHEEYRFQFDDKDWWGIEDLRSRGYKVFLVLICIKARQICCLTLNEFRTLINARMTEKRNMLEPACSILITLATRKRFRVYVNQPGRRNLKLAEMLVSRSAFPDRIFKR